MVTTLFATKKHINMNPFLTDFNTPFDTTPFDKIKMDHYLPAFKAGIEKGMAQVDELVKNIQAPNFYNTIEALERAGSLLNTVSTVFFNMNSAETNDEIQALAREVSPMLTEYQNDIMLNDALFKRIETVYNNEDQSQLSPEQITLLTKTYKGFVRNGAKLNADQKEKLRAIDKEKSDLALKFGENVLAESNAYKMVLTDKTDLAGLPDDTIEAAAITATQKGHEGAWVITLDFPSYIPFITYSENRKLREQIYKAFTSKAFKGNERDNQEIVKRIALLRHKRANLLGYESHAHFVLEERMAQSPDKVNSFLNNLLDNALPHAKKEMDELFEYSKSIGGPDKLEKWDVAFYAEKLKNEKFTISDELLKPYFKLENVLNGAFETAQKLFGITFHKRTDISVYHEDVSAYEVKNEKGEFMSVFYADFFPRSGKRQGAWMTSFKSQWIENGINSRPHISIVCNFTKPTSTKPSLLTFNEVTTLFHEFGHALHGMCANGNYASLSGTSVYWDFVELPSQIFENWCYENECLSLFAKHYETGEVISEEFIQKIKDSSNFNSGLATIRQLGFGFLDIAWHSANPESVKSVQEFERAAMSKTELLNLVAESSMSCSFSHIFQGGYSSGYYSYKWAEVLDADAFEAFKEKGIFDKEVANSFKKNVLSAGGSEHPAILYKRFRGREADSKALLRRSGLLDN